MTKVMGIVNVTPDSFSDGGMYFRPEEAVRRALNMAEEGADIIDFGAESTRPGAEPIPWEEEWRRLEPVMQRLTPRLGGAFPLVSVDTYHPETAERAVAAGAGMVNCVYAEPVPAMLDICAKGGAELVVPASCAGLPAGGVTVYLDPMVGFGTTREEDLELLRSVPELAKRGPVLVGASRKRIVKKLTGEKVTGKNLGGNLGIAIWCAMHGASIVRVHDVRETFQALKVVSALEGD
jgi:dihydropteroate synthase